MAMLDTSTQMLLDLYEHSPCGFHSLDAGGMFVRINDTELNWLGYTREEVVGRMNMADILTPEGQQTFALNFPRLKSEGVLRNVEFDLIRKDGTLLPVLVSATAVRDQDGNFVMSRSIVYDISNHRGAESGFRSILEASPDAMIICDRQGIISTANSRVQKVFGYCSYELHGLSVEALIEESSRKKHARFRERFFSDLKARSMGSGHELNGLRKDGTRVPVEISLSPLQSDNGVVTLATIRDLTDRRASQDELRKSEARYRSVVTAMAEGVVVQEHDGTISACNESAERILGLTEAQIMRRTSLDPRWHAIHEDGSPFPGDKHPAMVALSNGQRQANVCMGLCKPDGATTWILINAEPIYYPGTKRPRAVVTTFTDITGRKHLEEQLSQAQKLEAIGRLAGGIAHDFNNVLGVILGHCDLMAEKLSGHEAAEGHTSTIRKAALHASALTRQLLAFSRKQVMQMRSINFNEIVRSLSEMLRRVITENTELDLQLAPDLGWCNADPVQVEQVLMNLVVNARDAMPKGGRITISTFNVQIDGKHIGSHPPAHPGSYVQLSVSDTGSGMDEATLSRLFEPFYTTKEMGRGTGLGLSIVYGIVRQSNGHILVHSDPGEGSRFDVYLPRLQDADIPEAARPAVSLDERSRRSETILVVEDDDTLRDLITSMLAPCGYKVLGAATAREAIAVSQNHPGSIALLLTDMMLRGSADGQELSESIKVQRPGIRALFMTGYSELFVTNPPNTAAILQKPFSSEELRRRVFQALSTPAGSPASR